MNDFLKGILDGINSVLSNYGWSIMVFTLLIRMILLPFDYRSRSSMRKTAALQPKMAALQKKYAKDQQKLNQKMSELYRQEGVSPLSGCLPLLLSYPILIAMFGAMRAIANEQVVQQVLTMLTTNELPKFEGWLWIRNIWMPDSPFASSLPDFNTIRAVPADIWLKFINADVISTLPSTLNQLTVDSFSGSNLQATIQEIYNVLSTLSVYQQGTAIASGWTFNLLITTFSIMQNFNGLFLLPLFSALSQFLLTKMTPQQPQAQANPNDQAAATGKFMQWFFPIFSLWICSSYNGAFALYWVTSNLIAMAQTYIINKILDKKDAEKNQHPVSVEGTIK
ncbi:MAG: YidC/Oxa1 family membrane protein insertase [Clostridia bacterium]|nr:YidC/Oxa1 family membrane protein insertase [Clostridia bacterium]